MRLRKLYPSRKLKVCASTMMGLCTHTEVPESINECKLTLYDCEGHLVFDGAAHGAGTYRMRAYHDYDDDAGKSFALHLPLIDYSREKWMMVN